MKRRDFITLFGGSAVAWALAAHGQQSRRARRIGWLGAAKDHPYQLAAIAVFRKRLAELGWVEGRNLEIEQRWYSGDPDRMTRDAAELAAHSPDVLVGTGGASVMRFLAATRTLPIVFAHANDPVARGFVQSLARPGGNATGFTHLEYEMTAKWPALLKQIAPQVTRAAVMGNFSNTDGESQLKYIQGAAPALGLQLIPLEVNDAGDIERGIASFARGSKDGLIVTENNETFFDYKLIIALAARYHLPAIYNQRYYADAGGLISYAPDDSTSWRGVADYVDRIFKGAKPADLPVQQPTRYEMIINLKAAKALDLDISPALLSVADELIE